MSQDSYFIAYNSNSDVIRTVLSIDTVDETVVLKNGDDGIILSDFKCIQWVMLVGKDVKEEFKNRKINFKDFLEHVLIPQQQKLNESNS